MIHHAFLALGSNIDPERYLPQAVRRLGQHGSVVAVSNVWQSEPFGDPDQPDFLNAAVLLETQASAEEIVRVAIPAVEEALDRRRDPANKNGPRTIDIDLSLYDRFVGLVGEKAIPDPAILFYPFVAVPLSELQPSYVHPSTEQTLAEIAERLMAEAPRMTRRDDVLLSAAGLPTR